MTVVETDLACARVKVRHHRQSSRSNGITEKETKKSASTPGPSPGDRPTQRRITRRLVPRPLPIDESRLERRDHTKYPIPPPESIDPRSIAIQPRSFGRARARARRSSRRSSRAMTRPRRRWADTIFPKPFRSSSPRARADRIVPRRPSHDHRARRSYLPRARSPVRVVPRDASREGRRPPSIDEKKHCTHLDLGRLEGGDAADEGGSEESGHCSRVQEWRGARARAVEVEVGSGVRPTACPTDRPRGLTGDRDRGWDREGDRRGGLDV